MPPPERPSSWKRNEVDVSTYVFDHGWQKERDRLRAWGCIHASLADLGVPRMARPAARASDEISR